jgi:hypothetical protein
MNEHLTERQKHILLAVIFLGILLTLAVALTDRAGAAPAVPDWSFQATVQANCAADNLSADIGWTFWNRDSRTMRVTVVLADGTQETRDIPAGAIEAGTFTNRALPLAQGVVRFDMAWLGRPGTDSAMRDYGAVSCQPTAVTISSFGARPASSFCSCAKAVTFRWLDAQKRSCTFTTTKSCWGRVYLYQSPTACSRILAGWNYCGA